MKPATGPLGPRFHRAGRDIVAKRTITVRIAAEDDRLARACSGLSGESKPVWIGRAVLALARAEHPEIVRRLRPPPRGDRSRKR